MEAISFCLLGDSFRRAKAEAVLSFDQHEGSIVGTVQADQRQDEIMVVFRDARRILTKNGKKSSPKELSSEQPSVSFFPESLEVIKESPEFRRALLDEVAQTVDITALSDLEAFRKLLQVRNRVLKDHQNGSRSHLDTLDYLSALNSQYLNAGLKVTRNRINSLKLINKFVQRAIHRLDRQNVDISVDYVISGQSIGNLSDLEVADFMAKLQQERQVAELATGVSLSGPQRHDVHILYNGKDSRFFCSQGQQRSLILAFKIAQIVYHMEVLGKHPVLLLDDVLSELDSHRREYLVELLGYLKSQIFMTATDLVVPTTLSQSQLMVGYLEAGLFKETRTS